MTSTLSILVKKRVIGVVVIFFIGCAFALLMYRLFADPEIRWQEEVKLHDGRVIVVERWAKRQWMGEVGHRGLPLWSEIKARNPNTGSEVSWYEDAGSDVYVLDFKGDATYVAARVSFYHPCKKYHFPERDFVFFKFDGIWHQIPFEEFPTMFDTNVLFTVWTAASSIQLNHNRLSLEKKSEYLRSGWTVDQYSMRRLVEKPKNPRTACGEFADSKQR